MRAGDLLALIAVGFVSFILTMLAAWQYDQRHKPHCPTHVTSVSTQCK